MNTEVKIARLFQTTKQTVSLLISLVQDDVQKCITSYLHYQSINKLINTVQKEGEYAFQAGL